MSFRSLVLASAAALAASTAGHAADILGGEPADQYARICDVFGEGFFYIPNTDTCLKLGGYVRAESHYVDGDVALFFDGPDEEFNNWTSRARGNVQFEALTSSDFGLIRTYIEMQGTIGPADFEAYSESEFELAAAFIEVTKDWGVLTTGYTGSFFDFYGSDDYGTRIDIDDNTTEQNLFALTLTGQNGLRGTLSLEDPDSSGRRLAGADDYEGLEMPDLVGSIKLERDWGSAQLMGVLRHIHDEDGGDSDGVGFAVGAGFSVTLPVFNLGFSAQAGYADGALAYITTDPGGIGDFSGPDGDDTNQAWNVRAGLRAPLNDHITAWLDGSFTHGEDEVSDDEYDYWTLVAGAEFAPNDVIAMGPEVGYNSFDGDDPGEGGDVWGVMWRVQSDF